MNSLNIQQGSTVEYVFTDLIKKLYDVAISVSEPLEGEQDQAQLSGYISVGKSYEQYVKYLAGTVFYKNTGSIHNNPSGRFQNLRIDVTEDYYIPFEDSNVESVLKANNISSDGVGITHTDAAAITAFNTMFKNNTDITSFDELQYFTNYTTVGLAGSVHYGTGGDFSGCSSLESIDLRNVDWIDGKFCGCTSLREVKNFNGRGIISYQAYGNQFMNCTSLESINLSNCMLIGKDAFRGCTSLNSIGNLNNLIYAEDGAFVKCSNLQIDINIPRLRTVGISNTPIGVFVDANINSWNNGNYAPAYMFLSSGITSISNLGKCGSIADGYQYVYQTWNAGFASNCPNLTTVKLPKEMTYIGSYAFYGCPNLTYVKQYVDSIDDWVEGETPAVGNLTGITTFGSYCFTNCSNLTLTTADIANAVTLQDHAFKGSSLSGSVALPNITQFGIGAFDGTRITSVTNLGSITALPQDAFVNCTSLTSVTLPSTCTSIGNLAFADDSNLSSIDLSNVVTIGISSFARCSSLTGTLSLPSLTTLGESAFQNCTGITSIANLGDINTIPVNCFSGCSNLTSVIFPTTIRTIDNSCFYGCKIGQIILPYGYIGTGGWATVMRNSVGENCRYLQYPSTIQVVGTNDMFRDSSNNINCLIVVQATTPPTTGYDPNNTGGFGDGFSWGRPDKANWYVPDSVVNDYKSATGWDRFANKIYPISQLKKDSPTYWQIYQANKDYGVPQNNS